MKVYNVKQFSKEVGVHPATTRQWLREGAIKGMQVVPGGHWRIPESEILKMGVSDERRKGTKES